ncbi:MAG: carbohydrate ABC transporter permease [Chloroflexi bacterium]|nr:carbohydrate ABC transporter permease [Chloroflexota bacterium]
MQTIIERGRLTRRTRVRRSVGDRAFDIANYVFLALLGIVTIGPFLYLIFGSLTDATAYRLGGVSLNPADWTLDSYRILLGAESRIYQSFKITVFTTVVGTILSLLITAAMGYALSEKELPGHNLLIFLVFFTMMFGGGMVPFYLVAKWLSLPNTVWSIIFPFLVSAWYMLIMMKFFEALPRELEDAARIDGCSELMIFVRIVLPLSKPVLATVGLFYAVGYWNQWFWATIFLRDTNLQPLQLVLRSILSQLLTITDPELAAERAKTQMDVMPPVEVLRMGAIIVTVIPIAIVYPFLQKYFVQGVMIGAIKG